MQLAVCLLLVQIYELQEFLSFDIVFLINEKIKKYVKLDKYSVYFK